MAIPSNSLPFPPSIPITSDACLPCRSTHPLILIRSYRCERGLGKDKPSVMIAQVFLGRIVSAGAADAAGALGRQVDDVESRLVAMHRVENDLCTDGSASSIENIIEWSAVWWKCLYEAQIMWRLMLNAPYE